MIGSIVSQRSILNPTISEKKSIITENHDKISKGKLLSILIFVLLIWPPSMFFYDFPQLFADILIDQFKITTVEVSLLYTIPAIVSIPAAGLLGPILNKTGLALGAVIFSFMYYLGVLFCYVSVYSGNFVWMMVGRGLSNGSIEVLIVICLTISDKWFSGKFLSVSAGLSRLVSSMCMFLAAYFQPIVMLKYRKLETCLLIYVACSILVFLASVGYFFLERRIENELSINVSTTGSTQKDLDTGYQFKLKDFKHLTPVAKIAFFLVGLVLSCYYMFSYNGTDFLMVVYGLNYEQAKDQISLLPLLAMVITPLFSIVTNIFGKKPLFLTLTLIMMTASQFYWQFIPTGYSSLITIPVAATGCYYGLYNALIWVLLSLSLPKEAVSHVMGLSVAMVNILFTVFPVGIGYLVRDRTRTAYLKLANLVTGVSGAALFFSFVLMVVDCRTGKLLHLPENSEEAVEKRLKMSKDFVVKAALGSQEDYKSLGIKSSGRRVEDIDDEV
jgi:MFS family permease